MNLKRFAFTLTAALVLTGCSAQATQPDVEPEIDTESEETIDQPESDFPLTIDIPATESLPAQQITLDSRPERIAALTYETAELVAELGAMDRLVLVQEAMTNPVVSSFPKEMADVPHHALTEGSIDAEQVLAAEPDLVLITPRRGLEQELNSVLAGSGVPVLILPNQWANLTDIAANIDLVGEAIGAPEEASALTDVLKAGLEGESPADGEAPRVLLLSNQAGQPFVVAGTAFPLEILRLAGAVDAAGDLGFVRSGPISAEEVIAANPDAIVLVDMTGSGTAVFDPLLENDAVAELSAVASENVLLVEAKEVQALGFSATIDGRERLAAWLTGEVTVTP